MLKLINGVLQLLVKNPSVGYHNDRIENALIQSIVQTC